MSHHYSGTNCAKPGDPRTSILIMNVHLSAFAELFHTGFARCCSRYQMWSTS
jgi:hypothetical protein